MLLNFFSVLLLFFGMKIAQKLEQSIIQNEYKILLQNLVICLKQRWRTFEIED